MADLPPKPSPPPPFASLVLPHHHHQHHHHHHCHHHHHAPSCPLARHILPCPHLHSHLPFPASLPIPSAAAPHFVPQVPPYISGDHSLYYQNSEVGTENLDEMVVEEEDEGEPVFVLTDEWLEFFAKSEAKRKLEKKKKHKRRGG